MVTARNTATLEVGCGTARNLIKLARRPEPGHLYGLDASHEMLETAATSIERTLGMTASSAGVRPLASPAAGAGQDGR
ncbi:MAG: class I SAM-dependent methyltransferase, partial [Planctomycetia bacterium]